MKKNNEVKKEQAAKNQPPTSAAAPKVVKAGREAVVKVEKDEEPVDRLPATVEEPKESKGGLVTFLFLTGKEKDAITKELQTAFSLAEGQAVKIVRRITGRARFFRRAFDLMAAK
jgi:hypothetical protein